MSFSPPDCIRTFTGKEVNIFNPKEDMFCIEDIAHALSKEQRWGNHLPVNYSVAQHCIICSELAPIENKYTALMHDIFEAYGRDLPKPIKEHPELKMYKELEDKLMRFLSGVFGFQYPLPARVIEIDAFMAKQEWDGLMVKNIPFNYVLMNHNQAKKKFLQVYKQLRNI